ncbi:MAG: glutamate 5-kinase [Lentisphaeria bacterium]
MEYTYQDQGERSHFIKNTKRIIVKIGTQLLRKPDPQKRIEELIAIVAQLRKQNYEIIIVSSGAIGIGMTTLGIQKRPKNIARLQAYAAVGQCHLMRFYESACEKAGFHCAQLLLTAADLHAQERNLKVTQCLEALLSKNVIPIINENDSVCVDEIKIGDNDTLAAYVATMLQADLTILLTTVDGFHEYLPEKKQLGKRFSTVKSLNSTILNMARGTDGNPYSTGGMITKLKAAHIITTCGGAMIIADGNQFTSLWDTLQCCDIGTLFIPSEKQKLHNHKRFLAFFSDTAGDLIIDKGAQKALCEQNKSLLSGGILGTRGLFHRNDTVRIFNTDNQEIARGIVNFAYDEMAKICGMKSSDIASTLQLKNPPHEVVHKDNLVLTF